MPRRGSPPPGPTVFTLMICDRCPPRAPRQFRLAAAGAGAPPRRLASGGGGVGGGVEEPTATAGGHVMIAGVPVQSWTPHRDVKITRNQRAIPARPAGGQADPVGYDRSLAPECGTGG